MKVQRIAQEYLFTTPEVQSPLEYHVKQGSAAYHSPEL